AVDERVADVHANVAIRLSAETTLARAVGRVTGATTARADGADAHGRDARAAAARSAATKTKAAGAVALSRGSARDSAEQRLQLPTRDVGAEQRSDALVARITEQLLQLARNDLLVGGLVVLRLERRTSVRLRGGLFA